MDGGSEANGTFQMEAGTDVAQLVLYDPATLPTDFDERWNASVSGQFDIAQQLLDEGRAVFVSTGADGGYLLHAYVGESAPPYLVAFADNEGAIVVKNFQVPSGTLCFVGAEYASADAENGLRRRMGSKIAITPGTYELKLRRCMIPDDVIEQKFREAVGDRVAKLHDARGTSVALFFLSFIAMLAAGVIGLPDAVGAIAAAITTLSGVAAVVISQMPTYRRADEKWSEVSREFPSMLCELARHDSGDTAR